MKPRVQIDVSFLVLAIASTILFYCFPKLYWINSPVDDIFGFVGMIAILKGGYIRMAARGHKKFHSREGKALVINGLYQYVRNPMYLGTFLLGGGFLLMVWPWWILPLFGFAFYWRFKKQVMKEEAHLRNLFGRTYEDYCRRVPRVFPRLKDLIMMRVADVLPWQEVWATSEKNAFFAWPLVALIFELLQKKSVFGTVDIGHTVMIFVLAIGVFILKLCWHYRR